MPESILPFVAILRVIGIVYLAITPRALAKYIDEEVLCQNEMAVSDTNVTDVHTNHPRASTWIIYWLFELVLQ